MRLFLVDDDALVARTVGDCLRSSGFVLVGDASSLDEIHQKLSDGQVDLVLVDLKLSQTTRCPDFTFIGDLRNKHKGLKVVPLTGLRGGYLVQLAIANGAAGYAIKGCVPEELVWVVQHAREDNPALCRLGRAALAQKPACGWPNHREATVLQHLGLGLQAKESAARLGLEISTLESYRRDVRKKFGLGTQNDVQNFVTSAGLLI